MTAKSRKSFFNAQITNYFILALFSVSQCLGQEEKSVIAALEVVFPRNEEVTCVTVFHDKAMLSLKDSLILEDLSVVIYGDTQINYTILSMSCNVIIIWLEEMIKVHGLFERVAFKKSNVHYIWVRPLDAKESMPEFLEEAPKVSVIDPVSFHVTEKVLCPQHRDRHPTSAKYPDISCLTLRATTFEFPPFITAEISADGSIASYGGIEVNIFKTIAQKYDFDYTISQPTDGGKWGGQTSPGVFTGLVGDLQFKRSDIGWADLYQDTNNRSSAVDFIQPYSVDYSCFLVKMPAPLPRWMALASPLSLQVWYTSFITVTLSAIFMFCYAYILPGVDQLSSYDRVTCLLASILDESQPRLLKIRSWTGRTFLALFLIAIYTLTTGYRGNLITNLSVPHVTSPIDTLSQVVESNMPVSSFGSVFKRDAEQSSDPLMKRLVKNLNTHWDFDRAYQDLNEGKAILLESQQYSQFKMRELFTNEFGEVSVHLARECLSSYRVAFAVQKDSIFKDMFGDVIQRLNEGGFITKWTEDENNKIARVAKRRRKSSQAFRPLSMTEMQAALIAYAAMFLLALLVLAVEKLVKMQAILFRNRFTDI